MKKIIYFLLVALFFQWPFLVFADECMVGNCEEGVGTGFTEEGKIYSGEWQDGEPHGYGKLTLSKDKFLEGRWEKGVLVDEKDNKKAAK